MLKKFFINRYSLFFSLVIVFFIFIAGFGTAQAQKKPKTENIKTGLVIYEAGENESENEAFKVLRQRSEVRACTQAGVEVNAYYDRYSHTQNGKTIHNRIIDNFNHESKGTVTDCHILKKGKKYPCESRYAEWERRESGGSTMSANFSIEVTPDPSRGDPNFKALIENLKTNYKNGDPFNFTITPSQTAYTRIFIFSIETLQLFLIYPNGVDRSKLLQSAVSEQFPQTCTNGITTDQRRESVGIIIVLLKKDISYPKEPFLKGGDCQSMASIQTDWQTFYKWIASVDKDKRWLYRNQFDLYAK